MASQSSARKLLPKLAITATTVGSTLFACHHLESQRRPLDANADNSDNDNNVDNNNKCNAFTIPEALSSLQNSGVAIVHNLRLTPAVVREVKKMPAAESMPTELPKPKKRQQRRRGPPGANMMPADETWRLSAYGRYHRLENHLGEEDMKVLEGIERDIWPLVEGFFCDNENDKKKNGCEDCESDGGEGGATTDNTMSDIFRSELQLMTAVPGSTNQSWHRDNRCRGLSIIVPLVNFSADNGGTQLLLGSHDATWPLASSQQGARVVHAPAGSVVAYDSRTIHRGLGNNNSNNSEGGRGGGGRPALIFCYDRIESPPPGCGTLGSVATSYQGRIVDILTGARSMFMFGQSK